REFTPDGPLVSLDDGWAMMLPVQPGTRIDLTVFPEVSAAAELRVELRQSSRPDNHTPDTILEKAVHALTPGNTPVRTSFSHTFDDERYAFVCFFGDASIKLRTSEQRVTGVLSLCHAVNLAVAKNAVQTPPEDIGVDSFEFWLPKRRPAGQNLALTLGRALTPFGVKSLTSGIGRPTNQPNAWVAALEEETPAVTLTWMEPQTIARVELMFDTDFDHPMETVLWGHPEKRMPFCARGYRLLDASGRVLAEEREQHQTRAVILLPQAVTTTSLRIEITRPEKNIPAALFAVRCYTEVQP